VLDIGCGTGIWIDFWRQRGAAQIVGVDLVDASVQRLRKRYPEFEFIREDVADPDAALPSGMDIVSAMSVLLHITSDERFERGLRNILRCVGEGGTLVLVEPAVVHNWWGPPFSLEANSRTRPLSTYTRILADAGFCIVHLRPASCLLGNVIDTRHAASFRVLERQWELLSFIVGQRELVGRVAASVLRPLDLVATRLVSGGPSAKVMVVRRSEAPHKGS
jgi:SAM-dependent methyltransferase